MPDEERHQFLTQSELTEHEQQVVQRMLHIHEHPEQHRELQSLSVDPFGPHPTWESLEGRRIGAYILQEELGRGGMAVVLRAHQVTTGRQVALKLLHNPLNSPSLRQRFEVEVRVLGKLHHEGIARIYDASVTAAEDDLGEGIPYFAMEWVPGLTLRQYLDSHDLSVEERCELVAQVGDAVHHAHQQGVIHRDLKPSNIQVDQNGQPKVLDFGVARAADIDLQLTMHSTRTGELVGTLPYMSPEQLSGSSDAVDSQSDVYSLGVLLYEVLTGHLPRRLREQTLAEAIHGTLHAPATPLRKHDSSLPHDLELIVSTALQQEKDLRYTSAAALATDLRRLWSHEPLLARAPTLTHQLRLLTKRYRVATLIAAVSLTVIIISAAISFWFGWVATHERDEAQVARSESRQVSEFLADLLIRSGQPDSFYLAMLNEAESLLNRGTLPDSARATLHTIVGRGYLETQNWSAAEGHLKQAKAIRERLSGTMDAGVAETLVHLAALYSRCIRFDECERALAQVLEIRREIWGTEHLQSHSNQTLKTLLWHHLPDIPEHAWRWKAAQLDGPPPPPGAVAQVPLLFEEHFENGLDDWNVEVDPEVVWDWDHGNSQLRVITLEGLDEPHANSVTKEWVTLQRPLPQVRDFRLEFTLSWDQLDHGVEANHELFVELRDHQADVTARFASSDGWVQSGGRFMVSNRDWWTATPVGSLSPRGTAHGTIDRVRGRITATINGRTLATFHNYEPVVSLVIKFGNFSKRSTCRMAVGPLRFFAETATLPD